jgi:hypothetical protein
MRKVRNISTIILCLILIGLFSGKYCFGSLYANTDIFSKPDYNIWKTNYFNRLGEVKKYLYITNEDGVTMFLSTYQDANVTFVALGLKHSEETFTKHIRAPEYKSALCCWHPVEYFGDKDGIGLDNNTWVWMLNDEDSLTIKTDIVKSILESNSIIWRFDTVRGRFETKFKFSQHQVDGFPKLIKWLLKKEN